MLPTIVLVHGAFADSSSWNGVIDAILRAEHPVIAAANPLRGVAADDRADVEAVVGEVPRDRRRQPPCPSPTRRGVDGERDRPEHGRTVATGEAWHGGQRQRFRWIGPVVTGFRDQASQAEPTS